MGLNTPFSTPKITKDFWLNGLNINSFEEKRGIKINGSLEDFDTNVPPINQKARTKIVEGLVRKYLVTSEIENFNSNIWGRQLKVSGNPKVTNYFEVKKKKIDPLKERNLAIIWEWAKVLHEGEFPFGKLENMASEYSEHLRTLSAQQIHDFRYVL